MKYFILTVALLCAFQASAEKLSGKITQLRDNVAYIQTADGKIQPIILTDNTYYRKRKIVFKKNKKETETREFYQPLLARGDNVTLTYDPEGPDTTTGAMKASDVLITVE